MTDLSASDYLRGITLVLALIGIWAWVRFAFSHKHYWLYAVAPISWFAHVVIFYFFFFFILDPTLDAVAINMWSITLRLHSEILFVGAAFILMLPWKTM